MSLQTKVTPNAPACVEQSYVKVWEHFYEALEKSSNHHSNKVSQCRTMRGVGRLHNYGSLFLEMFFFLSASSSNLASAHVVF